MRSDSAMLEIRRMNTRRGGAHILRDIDLRVGRGEVLAVLGRNGAGKTTLIKSVMQLLRPDSGEVLFEGRNLVGLPPFRVARLGIGYVPEERRIFTDLRVDENLETGRRVGADGGSPWTPERLYRLFPNLAERRDHRGRALSGGEQQMLAIARTLMGNPRLLLLDEPSEGIAPVIVSRLAETFATMRAEGLTVLLSEQNLRFARRVADRVVVLQSGTLRFEGSFAALDARADILDAGLAV